MPFQYILGNLLANNHGAVGAIFLDPSGETIDLACADFTPYQMRVLGAYLGIQLRQVERIMTSNWLGEPRLMHLEMTNLHVHAVPLPDGYYVALVQRPPVQVAIARRELLAAAEQLTAELFTD